MGKYARRALRSAGSCLDWLIAPRCVLCGLPSQGGNLCPPCRRALPHCGHCCHQCGLPLAHPRDNTCGRCLLAPPPFDRCLSALAYEFPVPFLVQRFKFHRELVCGEVLGEALINAAGRPGIQRPDVLVAVPLHHRRECSRGFNQAMNLARAIQKSSGIPVSGSLLQRVRHTQAQSGLDAKARRKNIRGAFRCRPIKSPAPHVALVDDVMTTGATMWECARVLKAAGIGTVSAWVAARTPNGIN